MESFVRDYSNWSCFGWMEYHERGGSKVYIVLALLLDLLLIEQGGLLIHMIRDNYGRTNKEIQCYIINHVPLCLLGLLPVARNGRFEVRIAILNARTTISCIYFSSVPSPHIQKVPLLIEMCRIRSRFESEVPSLLMMTMSYLLSWDDILTLLDIDWTFWAPCWDPADSYFKILGCKSFTPHDLSGTLYAFNITSYGIIRLQWWPLTSSVSNQGMLLWIICTQANAIYANIILPKLSR